MIVLDTNILSALMQRVPDPSLIAWLDRQSAESIWISTVTVFEVRYGIEVLETGRRKKWLLEQFEQLVQHDLKHRVLPFDTGAAEQAGRLAAERKAHGYAVDMRDTFIAGIVLMHRATLATRNTRHFMDLGTLLVDPWAS